MNRQRARDTNRLEPSRPAARAAHEAEPALNVVTVFQDPLTRYWATELWDRVGNLIGQGGIRHQSWKISDLAEPGAFATAVETAAQADVLVVSARATRDWPLLMHVWIDTWLPRRAGRAGALVALIGIPAQPDAQSGRVHSYLETVARQAGLDFLPRERKLPEQSVPTDNLAGSAQTDCPMPVLAGKVAERSSETRLGWRLNE